MISSCKLRSPNIQYLALIVRFWLAKFWLTKSLVCIDAFIRDSTIQSDVRRFCTAYKLEDFGSLSAIWTTCHPVWTPICPLFHLYGRRAIPFGRPTDQVSSVRTTCIPIQTFIVSRSYCSSLYPSGRFSSPSGCLSVIDQLQILSKFNLREDWFNRPDDVDSRPDALIRKARIAIQISLSGRQSALVRMRVHQLRKLSIRLQPSRRLPIMVQTRA
jgi:hypothetical protein